MVRYKHIIFNLQLEGLESAINKAPKGSRLVQIVSYDMYEGVAVFELPLKKSKKEQSDG